MAIALAIIMTGCTFVVFGAILFAGNMRTTGGTAGDARSALIVLGCGLALSVLVAWTHWHPLGW
jgi:hypothetical protein